jgi:hypothetical protein
MKKLLIVDVPEGFHVPWRIDIWPNEDNKEDIPTAVNVKVIEQQSEDEIRERYLKQYHDDLARAVISADVEIQVWRGINGE